MDIKIENIPYCRIAYIRQIGPYGQNNVQIMEELKTWAQSKGLLDEKSVILGIAHDNPELVEPKNCRYDTCLVISNDYCIDDDSINEGCIHSGKYAVVKISHTAEAVQKAWFAIFPELFNQNYQLDKSRPTLERYKAELVKEHYCEICVPIH
ncbi:AraC family transcriptional regulator [Anaerocolumna xylanovorans]|uniref:DNA gyrase inhibitor GyrI n=1 Tax=Anaerocolumna xylanovorans DSM 12503 TaxID=1121345 RepID=A0A1M7YFX3_9FIRM|nr:GyrI-like domain-containing protein [Anaerocolumna xylanovorans]SHO51544.1 DNA gyrase inhibitor GyrI [Anaerocolumna xylanovorans DSM 12503]